MKSGVVFAASLLLCITGVVLTQRYVDERTDRTPEVEMRYLLETKSLQRASLGYPQLVADFVWIKAIQFYHQQFINRMEGETDLEKIQYKWLPRISDLVTDLNPKFVHAYWFFSLYMGGVEVEGPGWYDATQSLSMRLMLKGFENNQDTYFLSSNLAFSYLQYHRRLSEREYVQGMSSERRAELLELYHRECIRFADHAAAAPDAPEHVRLWGFSVRNALGGDQCETFELMRSLYDSSTQDIERQSQLFPLVLAADRCNSHQLTRAAQELGIELQPGTRLDLERALGRETPTSPWGPVSHLTETGALPPETYAGLMALHDGKKHRYEYFVSTSGEVLSWWDGERRESSQRVVATQTCELFQAQFGFWPRRPEFAAACTNREINPSPFGRRYLLDLREHVAYPEFELQDLVGRIFPWYDEATVEDRRRRMREVVRSVDAAAARSLRERLVEPWMREHPGEHADLARLAGSEGVPVSPWRLLDLLAETPDGELPRTALALIALTPRPDTDAPDYIVEPDGDVVARPIAEIERAELLQFLQQRLAAYREQFGAPPTVIEDLYRHLGRPLPPDPFGGSFAIEANGARVIVLEH